MTSGRGEQPCITSGFETRVSGAAVRKAVVLCVGVFAVLVLPLILSGYDHGRAWYDQAHYHLPAIVHFAHAGSLRDYPSATTPGYHLLLAAVAIVLPGSEIALKLFSLLISLVLVGVLAAYVARRVAGPATTLCLMLPMLVSLYFLPQGVWLVPDNLGWLTLFGVLLQAMRYQDRFGWYAVTSGLLLAAVLVRQSNSWLCAVALLSVLAAAPCDNPGQRLLRSGAMLAPAVLVLAGFVALWHALTPPSFVAQHQGVNLAVWPFLLCVFGFYGLFYLPLMAPRIRLVWAQSQWRRRILLGGALGFLLAALQPTDLNDAQGRVSGLWILARLGPDPFHRSLLITALSMLGGSSMVLWCALLPRRLAAGVLCTMLAYALAQTTNHMVFERYFAEFVFILLLVMSAELVGHDRNRMQLWRFAPLWLLTLINAGILVRGLRS
jgi:hypothetical protein